MVDWSEVSEMVGVRWVIDQSCQRDGGEIREMVEVSMVKVSKRWWQHQWDDRNVREMVREVSQMHAGYLQLFFFCRQTLSEASGLILWQGQWLLEAGQSLVATSLVLSRLVQESLQFRLVLCLLTFLQLRNLVHKDVSNLSFKTTTSHTAAKKGSKLCN